MASFFSREIAKTRLLLHAIQHAVASSGARPATCAATYTQKSLCAADRRAQRLIHPIKDDETAFCLGRVCAVRPLRDGARIKPAWAPAVFSGPRYSVIETGRSGCLLDRSRKARLRSAQEPPYAAGRAASACWHPRGCRAPWWKSGDATDVDTLARRFGAIDGVHQRHEVVQQLLLSEADLADGTCRLPVLST